MADTSSKPSTASNEVPAEPQRGGPPPPPVRRTSGTLSGFRPPSTGTLRAVRADSSGSLAAVRTEPASTLPAVVPEQQAALEAPHRESVEVSPLARTEIAEAAAPIASPLAVTSPPEAIEPKPPSEPRPAPTVHVEAPVTSHPAVQTSSGVALPVGGGGAKPLAEQPRNSRKLFGIIALAAAGSLGVAMALLSTRGSEQEAPAPPSPPKVASPSPALEPAAAHPQPADAPASVVEQPPAEQPAAQAAVEQPSVEPPPAAPPTNTNNKTDEVLGGQSSATCEQLMATHRSPRKSNPIQYEYLHQLHTARRELVRGNVDAAHAAFCRATLDPGADLNVWVEFAQLLVLRGDGAAALPWVEKALAFEPKNPRARGLLGDALLLAGRADDARGAFLAAANRGTGDAAIERLVRQSLAEAEGAMKKSDLPRAERFFRRVLAFDAENTRAKEQLAAIERALAAPPPAQ